MINFKQLHIHKLKDRLTRKSESVGTINHVSREIPLKLRYFIQILEIESQRITGMILLTHSSTMWAGQAKTKKYKYFQTQNFTRLDTTWDFVVHPKVIESEYIWCEEWSKRDDIDTNSDLLCTASEWAEQEAAVDEKCRERERKKRNVIKKPTTAKSSRAESSEEGKEKKFHQWFIAIEI